MDQVDQMYSFLENNPVLQRDFALTNNKYSNSGKEVVELPREKTTHRTLVACSCCNSIIDAKDAKCTMVRSAHEQKWIKIWNPLYVTPTKALIATEDGMQIVEQDPNNPEIPRYIFHKVDLKNVEYTCKNCLEKPVHLSVLDTTLTPEHTLEIADLIRSWRGKYGARLRVLGFGRKIDQSVEFVCQKLNVIYKEVKI